MIEAEIRSFIQEAFFPPEDLGNDASLFDTGTIDSTGMLEVIAHIEDRYAIRVADRELLPENFDSIARLTAYVRRKLEQPG